MADEMHKNWEDLFNHTMALNRSKQRVKPEVQGRNEKCNCGSGKKFKKCCLKKG